MEHLSTIRTANRGSLRFFMEGSFDAMLLVGAQGHILSANSAAVSMLGAGLGELRGKHVERVLKPQRDTTHLTPQLLRDLTALDGSLCFLEGADQTGLTALVKQTNGKAGETLWVLREVSRTQPVVHALEKKTRLLSEAERVGRMGTWEFDPTTRTIIWTPELQRLMGTKKDTITVEHSSSFYVGASRNMVREAFRLTLSEGRPYDLELEVMTGNGCRMWIREVCRPTFRRGKLISIVGVVQDISERRHMADLLAQSVDRERTRIAADLHDGVGQELAGLALELAAAAAQHRQKSPEAARDFSRCSEAARKTLSRLRDMSHALLPLGFRETGFNVACRHLASSVSIALGVRVQFRFIGNRSHAPVDATAEHLYRIAQEAMANAITHGAARRIIVTLTANASKLLLTISDDGSGMNPSPKRRGVGVRLMHYRARLLGGVLAVTPSRQGGTRVRCVVPRSDNSSTRARTDTQLKLKAL